MPWRQFLHAFAKGQKGFTAVEFIVSATLGLFVCGMSLSAIFANRELYQLDLTRTKLNQNLRTGMDLVGVNIREAGENLSEAFPALELTNGASDASDELVLRRNLVDEVLKLCQPITGGTTVTDIYFAYPSEEAGCAYSDQEHNFGVWQNYRTDNGGKVRAYIYDPTTQQGEFFDYVGETKAGTMMSLSRDSGQFSHDYTVGQTAIYLLEEWTFKAGKDSQLDPVLQVIQNGDQTNPLTVTFDVTNFQVQITKSDGTTVSSLSAADNWTDIQSVGVILSGSAKMAGKDKRTITREYSASYFPRNVLSH